MTVNNLVTNFYDEIISEAMRSTPLPGKMGSMPEMDRLLACIQTPTYILSSLSLISGNSIRNLRLEKHNSQAEFMKSLRAVLVPAERLISAELSRTKEKRSSSYLFMSHCFRKI